jgi:cell division septal protein FtsQ
VRNHSKRIQQQKFLNKSLIIFSIIFVLLLIYLLFFSPVFHIKQIFVYNIQNTDETKLKEDVIGFLRNYHNSFFEEVLYDNNNFPNVLFFKPQYLEKDILINFSNISQVQITKNIFHKELKIEINERSPVFQISNDNIVACLDSFGYVFNSCSKHKNLPLIKTDFLKSNIFYFKESDVQIFKDLIQENKNLQITYSEKTPKSFKILNFDDKIDILLPLNDKAVLAYRAAVQYYAVKQSDMSVLDARYYPEKFYFK